MYALQGPKGNGSITIFFIFQPSAKSQLKGTAEHRRHERDKWSMIRVKDLRGQELGVEMARGGLAKSMST